MKYYKVEDVQSLIAACKWRMTLAKEQGGVGFVEYDKTIIDIDEFQKRLSALELVEASENAIKRDGIIKELRLEYPSMPLFKESRDEWLLKTEGYRKAEEIIKNASSTISKPKEGKWIRSNIQCEEWICSECGGACWYYDVGKAVSKSNYCPNCGTKMKGVKISETD